MLIQSNERVLNRLFHVKKYIHKLSRERRGLAKKLTELGDEFKKSDLTVPLEDELPGAMIGAAESPSSSGPAMAENAAVFSPFSQGGPTKGEETLSLKDTPQTPAVQGKPGRKKRSRDVNKPEREKDPNAPKKPANAFLMYCQQERQKVQDGEGNGIYSADLSHQDLTRQLAKQWKFLSEEEKKHYYLMYEKEKDRYDKAVKKYAKGAGNDKKKASRDNGHDGDSEMIDVVKMGQEKDWKPKDFREEKIKTSHTSEDQTIDVEKDEFEFNDPQGMAEEPKICLEKIDKSKLFDKARLFGFPSLDSHEQVPNVSKAETDGKQQLRDFFMKTDVRPFSRSPQPSYKGPAILEIATGRKSASPTILSHAAPKMLPEAPMRPSMDLSIKELVGARPGSFELRNPAMMELKSKGEERTVLASALQNKPMFDIKMRSSTDYTKSKPILDVTGPSSDTSSSWGILSSDLKSKVPLEMKSRFTCSAEQEKPKTLVDSSPRTFTESKTTVASELRSKPPILETTKSSSPLESRVRGSPETMRRLSLDNKRAVVELKKIPVDPSDDPYHFDD
ncbi:uncharacterized protein LOC129270420 [Lytechinus pictus]|uniref:uncharacterized protein LOC129270420 n=1 Tax=Lytechinus pictus TaxID=7653 RepID=UPI0030BA001F